MKTIFETCDPRPEVLKAELREDIFAARLRDVMEGRAEIVYGDPATFFENPYPTNGLCDLLREALGRLTGTKPNSASTARPSCVRWRQDAQPHRPLPRHPRNIATAAMVKGFLDGALLPSKSVRFTAGVVGFDMEPAIGFVHPDTGPRTFTLGGRSMSDDRRLAARRPGPSHRRNQQEARLVGEDKMGAQPRSAFFTLGQPAARCQVGRAH